MCKINITPRKSYMRFVLWYVFDGYVLHVVHILQGYFSSDNEATHRYQDRMKPLGNHNMTTTK